MLEKRVEKIIKERNIRYEQNAELKLKQLAINRSQDLERQSQLEKTKLLQQKTNEAAAAAEKRAIIIREARKRKWI